MLTTTPRHSLKSSSGLQAANRAVIIQDGDQPQDFSSGTHTIELPDKIKVRIRTVELLNPDGSIGLQPDAVGSY